MAEVMKFKSKINYFKVIFVMIFFVSFTNPVKLGGDSISSPKLTISTFSNVNVCLKPNRASSDYVSCFGNQMLKKLQDLEDKEEFNLIDGISMRRDESGPRDISNYLDKDPMDIRSIMEGAGTLMSRRAVQWDMGFIYPGLNMRIGPALSANGVLEFVLDPRIRDQERIDGHESTARLFTRSLILPFLLGFKFQLATLLPLIFGVLVLLSKKALILAKIAVFASSYFGYNSLYGHGPPAVYGTGLYGGGGGFGGLGGLAGLGGLGGLGGFGGYRQNEPNYLFKQNDAVNYEDKVEPYYTSNNYQNDHNLHKIGQEQSSEDLRDRLERLFSSKDKIKPRDGARNFAWNEEKYT